LRKFSNSPRRLRSKTRREIRPRPSASNRRPLSLVKLSSRRGIATRSRGVICRQFFCGRPSYAAPPRSSRGCGVGCLVCGHFRCGRPTHTASPSAGLNGGRGTEISGVCTRYPSLGISPCKRLACAKVVSGGAERFAKCLGGGSACLGGWPANDLLKLFYCGRGTSDSVGRNDGLYVQRTNVFR